MFSVQRSSSTSGKIRLDRIDIPYKAESLQTLAQHQDKARAKAIRQWLKNYVLNRGIANEHSRRYSPEKTQCFNVLMSFLKELESLHYSKTFKSVSVHAEKYLLLSRVSACYQNEVLSFVISYCDQRYQTQKRLPVLNSESLN